MATVTRVNGNSGGVPGVDVAYASTYVSGTLVQTGLGKRITAFKILPNAGTTFFADMGVGGAVEAILRTVADKATIVAYQVQSGANGQMALIVEGNGWLPDTDYVELQNAIQALTSVNGLALTTVAVTAANGIKLV